MKVHELKIYPHYFEEVLNGNKPFELRKDDRGYEIGDILILKEFEPYFNSGIETTKESEYTGREIKKTISYIYRGYGDLGLQVGFCILGLNDYIECGYITDDEIYKAFGVSSELFKEGSRYKELAEIQLSQFLELNKTIIDKEE